VRGEDWEISRRLLYVDHTSIRPVLWSMHLYSDVDVYVQLANENAGC